MIPSVNKTLAFRVEHPRNGGGPYRFNSEFEILDDMFLEHGLSSNHPGWRSETVNGEKFKAEKTHMACFSNLFQLAKWFENHISKLEQCGFVFCVYEVEDLIEFDSKKQAVFDQNRAHKIVEFSTFNEIFSKFNI